MCGSGYHGPQETHSLGVRPAGRARPKKAPRNGGFFRIESLIENYIVIKSNQATLFLLSFVLTQVRLMFTPESYLRI